MLKNLIHAAAAALPPPTVPASASSESRAAQVQIACPDGYVCFYPATGFGGHPWVRRASDGSVKDLPPRSVTVAARCASHEATPWAARAVRHSPVLLIHA
ncbi:peptidase inhibitor family I36 protein [Streptomyces fumanus]|uniref:Uncharacterized protein n=1 Tax=Streptomyces fumanus TaxID=67302 RepID=A0A919E0N7_9ACTN|nr:peptidase inhibitor family I36 protein [Streptomyces fumanus]GHE98552.1 hypothetical protein GCM10018772_23730 [Streptomyces fumanus]